MCRLAASRGLASVQELTLSLQNSLGPHQVIWTDRVTYPSHVRVARGTRMDSQSPMAWTLRR